ncbi:MAG: GGDEF domain-containing protein [Oscillospiraceae bacterium]|nr:GGDEF domain-containing protein [Oscillospiraceae bacterium]
MITGQTRIIGVCLSTIHEEDRFYFIRALNKHAVAAGFRLMIFNACSDLYSSENPDIDSERNVFRLIPYDQLSGMIVFPQFLYHNPILDEVVENCLEKKIPVVSIDKEIEGCLCFSFSYEDIFRQLCCHVIDVHGAKNLMMVAGFQGNTFSDERARAFKNVLTERGLYYDDSLVGYGNFWDSPTLDLMVKWFEEEQRPYPDAIICANDSMAIVVSSYLQKHHVRVPEDCIVTGFDGIMQAQYHIPQITTCRQDYDKMGQQIVKSIEARLAGKTCPKRQMIGFRLICSQSCGCQPVSFYNINDAAQEIYNHMRLALQRQEMMCTVQASLPRMQTIEDLPAIFVNKFILPTTVFAINEDMFDPPGFGLHHRGAQAFSERIRIIMQRYFWYEIEPCTINRSELLPAPDLMLSREEPILVCALHFLDLSFGYCLFQPEISLDDYQKMHTFMSAVNAAFGTFHGQVQIRSINSQLKEVNAELEKLYVHDSLTGLLNRRGFYKEFRSQMKECKQEKPCAFLISADLDRLKYINDTYGHLEGDNAIITVAQALLHACGPHDICARFGGDEFAVGGILPESLAESCFQRFRCQFAEYLKRYNDSAGNPYPVEASIGCYAEPLDDTFDFDHLIRTADDRMYAQKQKRRRERDLLNA